MNRLMRGTALATPVLALALGTAQAEDVLVETPEAYAEAAAKLAPGDALILADGEWRDFAAVFDAVGTAEAPITLRAETPGGVRLTGLSSLAIGGEHLVVSGLTFTDGHSPTGEVVSFRSAEDKLASNVRLTETVIEDYSHPDRAEQDSWVVLYGQDNIVDHSAFLGKTNKGPTLIVRLDAEQTAPSAHVIEANYFGPRSPLGGNGGETLRIGVSQTSDVNSGVTVRGNLFERCDGEVEIISIKAEGNLVTENLFYESRGSVVFRHGGMNTVSRNVILGNGVRDTGGIRVINDSQTVTENYLEGLRGRKFLGALVVMNGVPNSPQNRYHQVTDASITRNSLIDVAHLGFGVGTDTERSAVPVDSAISANLIVPTEDGDLGLFDDMSGVDFSGNVTTQDAFAEIAAAVKPGLDLTEAPNGLRYPAGDAVSGDIGAPRDLKLVDRDAVGPRHYDKPALSLGEATEVSVAADEAALRQAIASAAPGTVITVARGEIDVTEPLVIDRPLTIRGKGRRGTTLAAAEGLFILDAGGGLSLENVKLYQASADTPLLHARGETYRGAYRLSLHKVDVRADAEAVAPLLAADPETFASAVMADKLTVKDWPGAVFDLSGEGLDGYYLADDLMIENSRFENVRGPVAAYGREGRDESTFGPRFSLKGSKLDGVGAGQGALQLVGIDGLALSGNRFSDSGDVTVKRRVLGLPFAVGANKVSGGTALTMTGVEDEAIDGSLSQGVTP